MKSKRLDCIVIGYNETPFAEYEQLLRSRGEDSEAYRDLKYSFVNLKGKRVNYIDLLNHVDKLAFPQRHGAVESNKFISCNIPNLAAVYLTQFLRRRGCETRYINLFQYEKDDLAQYLAEETLCVAITTTFYLLNLPVVEMVKFIREHNKSVKIVVGGPLIANHVRNYKGQELQAALEDIGADIYVSESQGEFALFQIVSCLRDGGDLSKVANILYFENDKLNVTNKIVENNSLDENFIDWGSFSGQFLGPTLQTRTARSCAFSCSFCNYPTRAGKLTLADLETVERELDSMRSLGYVKNVVFIDDTFNVPLARFKDLCRLMIKKKYMFNWFSYFRCSNSDEEAIELMAQSGCRGVFLGIESGSPGILKNMNKAATIEKYAKGIGLLRRNDILTFASLIVGFPGETDKTVKETIDFIQSSRPDYYRAQLWYCEPGTPIEAAREKYDISGHGFIWSHSSMESLEAMDYIDRMFLMDQGAIWLPQWSFDFWTIPYFLGLGIQLDVFKKLMAGAHKLLALEIASVQPAKKELAQQEILQHMVQTYKDGRPLV